MVVRKRPPHPKQGSLVDQLRQAIADCGETQYRIAKDSGVPQPVVNRFVTGQRGLTLETAAKLASYLRLRLCPLA
jgi:plasmid maintenance system antidote protein VapI